MSTPVDIYQTIDPSTEKVLKTFPGTSDIDVSNALDKAQKVYSEDWRSRSYAERARIVSRAADILRRDAEQHAQLITKEMGKLIDQSRFEVNLSADILTHYAEHAESFLKTQKVPEQHAVIISEPIGVILAIEPWNFPYYQLARVAGPQIMAGNVVIVKPAPITPQCSLAFAKLFEDAGAPEGVYTNIFSSIDQVGTLIDDFRVRGVTLTGSERAGAAVAERAGKNLKKVVLELGGSDPFVILEDADLNGIFDTAIQGRLMSMGQACGAAKRFIVVGGKERSDQFLQGLLTRLNGLSAGEPTDSKTLIGPMASKRGLDLLLDQIDSAVKNGASIAAGGKRIQRPGFYLEPTVITNISKNNPLSQQETFGPIFSVFSAKNEQEAIDIANNTTFGLGASIFSADAKRAQHVAEQMECGMVFVNSGVTTAANIPWGGVKNSGWGRELGGELGIIEFVNKKLIRTP